LDLDGGPARQSHLWRCLPSERSRAEHLQLRARERAGAAALVRRVRGHREPADRREPAAAGLRAGDEGQPYVQPARRAPRDQRHRTPALHPARAHAVAQRGRGLRGAAREARLPRPEEAHQGAGRMSVAKSLLIELGTEELPPKALDELSAAFLRGICDGLAKRGIEAALDKAKAYCSPRRLAIHVPHVATTQPEQSVERRGPAVNAALDAEGKPGKALLGFAQSCGVAVEQLEKLETDKGAWFVFRAVKPGQTLAALLPEIVDEALKGLPVPRPMRWADHDYAFVRPVHWLVMLHGADIVDGEVLGLASGRKSRGHRFMHPQPVHVADADGWLDAMR